MNIKHRPKSLRLSGLTDVCGKVSVYNQNGRGRSMKKFCEEEGYGYEKFMQYSRRGQKDYSVLKEADDRQLSGGFIPLVVDRMPEGGPSIRDVSVRFTNGMELSQ